MTDFNVTFPTIYGPRAVVQGMRVFGPGPNQSAAYKMDAEPFSEEHPTTKETIKKLMDKRTEKMYNLINSISSRTNYAIPQSERYMYSMPRDVDHMQIAAQQGLRPYDRVEFSRTINSEATLLDTSPQTIAS